MSSHSISIVDLSSVQGGMNAGAPENEEVMQAMSAFSYDGELIALPEPVVLAEGTDIWLGKLEQQIGAAIHLGISAASSMAINTNNFEEVAVHVSIERGVKKVLKSCFDLKIHNF